MRVRAAVLLPGACFFLRVLVCVRAAAFPARRLLVCWTACVCAGGGVAARRLLVFGSALVCAVGPPCQAAPRHCRSGTRRRGFSGGPKPRPLAATSRFREDSLGGR